MKNLWKQVRIPVLIITLGLVVLWLRQCNRDAVQRELATLTVAKDSVKYFRDKYNQEHAQIRLLEGDYKTLSYLYQDLLRTKAKELGVKPRHIKAVTNFTTHRELNMDSLIAANTILDTVYVPAWDGTDSIVYITTYRNVYLKDSLSVTQYSKRVNLFRRRAMIDVISYTKDAQVRNVESFRVKQSRPNLILGPSLTYTYTPLGWRVMPGVSLTYNLFGLRIGKQK